MSDKISDEQQRAWRAELRRSAQNTSDERAAAALALPDAKGRENYAEYLARDTPNSIEMIGRLLRRAVPDDFSETLSESKLRDQFCVWPENRQQPPHHAPSPRSATPPAPRAQQRRHIIRQSDVPINGHRYVERKAFREATRTSQTQRSPETVPAATASTDRRGKGTGMPSEATTAMWNDVVDQINSEMKR